MRAFVTGGSGFLGRNLVRRLADRGDEVMALARSDVAAETVRSVGASAVRGDLDSVDAMVEGMAAASVTFHVAGKTDEWDSRVAFERVNVTGTEHVIKAARRAGVDRLVYVSTEAVLVDGSPYRKVDETQPIPDSLATLYGETKARGERLVRAANGNELATVAIRPPLIWGPEDSSVGAKFASAVERGRFAWINGGRYPISTAYVENVVEGLCLAADAEGVGGEAFFVTDGEPAQFRAFLTGLLEARGLSPGTRSLPRPLAKGLAIGLDRLYRGFGLDGPPPITPGYVYLFGLPMTLDDAKAQEELGYEPVVSRDEGLDRVREAHAPN